MTDYVLGFAFTMDRHRVLLIEKRRPAWQAGLWNGIGGKIEAGETPLQAMSREAVEEAGIKVAWSPLATLRGDGFLIHVFQAFNDNIMSAESRTDERVSIHGLSYLKLIPAPRNIPLLVALALDTSGIAKPIHLREGEPLQSPEEVDERVTGLLQANNVEVHRRREAEAELRTIRERSGVSSTLVPAGQWMART